MMGSPETVGRGANDDVDIRYPPEAEAFRLRIRSFLQDNLPADWHGVGALDRPEAEAFTAAWRRVLHQNGLLGLSWPREYGGAGLSKVEHVVLAEEFTRVGVPVYSTSDTFSIKMVGNVLLRMGTEAQRRRFLPRILSGEDVWCQGYSEPDAGSDLGSLTTRAEREGDDWVITGQKIWTTRAQVANWIFLLARTDAAAPKHRGISFLLCPLHQPGIEIRPIRQMGGDSDFNEVFFREARTPADHVVGQVNGGWPVAMALLGYERGEESATTPIAFRAEFDRLLDMARERGRTADPVVRDKLAAQFARVEIMRFLGYRILTDFLRDRAPGTESSTIKLFWSQYHRDTTRLAVEVLGAAALVPAGRPPSRSFRADDPGAPNSSASWVGVLYNAVAGTIYAGSSEIQRNILGESILGLPKEPATPQG
jgi:alkylation response protein AidB-like acyl-CoA dehydrogenase